MRAPVAGLGEGVPALAFHHLGLACRSLDVEERAHAVLGYTRDGEDFEDPRQGVRGRFLVGPGPRLELLQALPGSTVLDPWLSGGGRLYHQAFTCASLSATAAALRAQGARAVSAPQPAVAFGGRCVSFLMLRSMLLIELIQA